MKYVTLCLLWFVFCALPVGAESGEEIMQEVMDTQQAESSAMDIRMVLADPDGDESIRRFQTLVVEENGLRKTITVFLEPASVKNTRFLTIENESRADDQWIYLPALRKAKRIAASERSGSFMGSDFSYSDMSLLNAAVTEASHTLLREEAFNGFECYVVESIPTEQSGSEYGKHISWVDKATWLTPKVELYGQDQRLQKMLETREFDEVQGYRIAREMTMTTVASGHKTILEVVQVKYDIPIDPGYFTTTFLESGRTR